MPAGSPVELKWRDQTFAHSVTDGWWVLVDGGRVELATRPIASLILLEAPVPQLSMWFETCEAAPLVRLCEHTLRGAVAIGSAYWLNLAVGWIEHLNQRGIELSPYLSHQLVFLAVRRGLPQPLRHRIQRLTPGRTYKPSPESVRGELCSEEGRLIALVEVSQEGDLFSGRLVLFEAPGEVVQLFEAFEECVNGQVFSEVDRLDTEIAALGVRFAGGIPERPLSDLQIYPTTRGVSFRVIDS